MNAPRDAPGPETPGSACSGRGSRRASRSAEWAHRSNGALAAKANHAAAQERLGDAEKRSTHLGDEVTPMPVLLQALSRDVVEERWVEERPRCNGGAHLRIGGHRKLWLSFAIRSESTARRSCTTTAESPRLRYQGCSRPRQLAGDTAAQSATTGSSGHMRPARVPRAEGTLRGFGIS